MKKLIIVILITTISLKGKAQFTGTPTSIKNLYYISDTTETDLNTVTVNVNWMDSIIQVRFLTGLEYDIEATRKFRKDSSYSPSEKEMQVYLQLIKTASQNCHSYALEKYFEYHSIEDSVLFNDESVLVENKYMRYILSTAFKMTKTISTKRKKNFKAEFTKGSLLIFRNKNKWTVHTVFYDGIYHSKNGATSVKSYNKLIDIYNIYWDTVLIEEYVIDEDKVNKYRNKRAVL